MSYLCLGMHIFLFSSLWFTFTQKCYTSDFHLIMCDYVKKTIENIKEPEKRNMYYSL
jgi:hypothetical protein